MRWIFFLLCSGTLLGCTPMEWRRGGEVATLESDVYLQCRNLATLAGTRYMPFPGIYHAPIGGMDRFGRPYLLSPSWSLADQFMVEHMSLIQCMAGQGFDLVPAAPEAKKTP